MGWTDGPTTRLGDSFLLDDNSLRRVYYFSPSVFKDLLTLSSIPYYSVYFLYTLVRRPRLILDFTLTLVLIHLVLTTYYSGALPSSLFVWCVLAVGAVGTVIGAEQLCVRREMREGLQTVPVPTDIEEIEMGTRRPQQGLRID